MRASTPAQHKAIILAGRAHGLDLDALRDLTPAGSLRALSMAEASALLDRLNTDRPRRERPRRRRQCPEGVIQLITPAQRCRIEALRARLGWTPDRLDAFAIKSFKLSMATLASRRDASRLIATLEKLLAEADERELHRGCAAMDRLEVNVGGLIPL